MTAKQTYDTPTLTVVGTFEDVTQAFQPGHSLDAFFTGFGGGGGSGGNNTFS